MARGWFMGCSNSNANRDCDGLGDTGLLARVENDYNVYGDELKFGGGKTFREGQGQVD